MIFCKSLLYLLTFLSCTRATREMGSHSLPDTKAKQQIAMWAEHLPGTWQLVKTIRCEYHDTIIQEPTVKRWLNPGAKPFTTLVIDSSRHFVITQACMKCPLLEWEGHYQIETIKIKDQTRFYMDFIDARQSYKKRKEPALTAEFNGLLKRMGNNEFSIVDHEGCEWLYRRWTE